MATTTEPISTVDPYEYLQITQNPDGTITRHINIPELPAEPDSTTTTSKDIPTTNAFIRIFTPRAEPTRRRPLIIYFHGGGFVILSPASAPNHAFCSAMASALDAVVASVGYRLAPEHRLPAAYHDAAESLRFLAASTDLAADLSNTFLMGTSAGGNLAFHAGLRAAADGAATALSPMRIRGLILHHAFFGGVARTESEVRLVNNPYLPLSGSDVMWDLALPAGADRDHEYSNPTAVADSGVIGRVGWKVFVMGCGGDPLYDRLVGLAEMLKNNGVEVVGVFLDGFYHGFEILELHKAGTTFDLINNFIKM